MKNKKIILGILGLIVINCSNINAGQIATITQSDYQKNENQESILLDNTIIHNRMNEFEALQNKILMNGTMEEIDRVILENSLLKAFNVWKGTKYIWGGDSAEGIDCSALTRRIYRAVFNYELPRVAIDQANQGRKIDRSELKPGDILFFRPEERVNHTAVYLGNSLFLNASTSQGVVISTLESKYWGKYFKYAVRVDKARQSV